MIDWQKQKKWIILLCVSICVASAAPIFFAYSNNIILSKRQKTETRITNLLAEQEQLRADIQSTEQGDNGLTQEQAEKLLAPINRRRVIQTIEQYAASALISNLSYTLSSETSAPVSSISAGSQTLALSTITLNGQAPTDVEVEAFLLSLTRAIPGRLSFKRLSITRIAATQILATNVSFSAEADWLSNGSPSMRLEGTP